MVTVEFTERERDALQRFLLEFAPDAGWAINGWEPEDRAALDEAYEKLYDTVAQ